MTAPRHGAFGAPRVYGLQPKVWRMRTLTVLDRGRVPTLKLAPSRGELLRPQPLRPRMRHDSHGTPHALRRPGFGRTTPGPPLPHLSLLFLFNSISPVDAVVTRCTGSCYSTCPPLNLCLAVQSVCRCPVCGRCRAADARRHSERSLRPSATSTPGNRGCPACYAAAAAWTTPRTSTSGVATSGAWTPVQSASHR